MLEVQQGECDLRLQGGARSSPKSVGDANVASRVDALPRRFRKPRMSPNQLLEGIRSQSSCRASGVAGLPNPREECPLMGFEALHPETLRQDEQGHGQGATKDRIPDFA